MMTGSESHETPDPVPASFGFAFGLGLLVAALVLTPTVGLLALLLVVFGIILLGASLADILDHLHGTFRE